MPILYYGNYKLAAAWNNAAGLSPIETILAVEGMYPAPLGTYDPGERRKTGDGLDYFRGYPSCQWPFVFIYWAKHKSLMSTYCAGSYSGKVTVRTRIDDSANYANFNAIINLPKLPDTRPESLRFEDYIITFTRMVAI